MNFKRITCRDARELMRSSGNRPLQVVDVRDDESFGAGHIESAWHLHGANMEEFLEQADPEAPVLVYCYHGNMSQSAAAYLAERGFSEAYSLDGGYEQWCREGDGQD